MAKHVAIRWDPFHWKTSFSQRLLFIAICLGSEGLEEAPYGAFLCCFSTAAQGGKLSKPLRNMLGQSPLPDTQSPGDSMNPLGQLYSLSVIKSQSFLTCDEIEARGCAHNEHF